jgi:hypothetical protein
MPATGELTLTYALSRRLTQAAAGRTTWLLRGLGVLFLGAATVNASGEEAGAVAAQALLGLTLLALPELFPALAWVRLRRPADRPFRYELTEHDVTIGTAETTATVAWTGISAVRTTRHLWLFTVAATRGRIAVPRAAFDSDQQAAIDGFLATARPAPAR